MASRKQKEFGNLKFGDWVKLGSIVYIKEGKSLKKYQVRWAETIMTEKEMKDRLALLDEEARAIRKIL